MKSDISNIDSKIIIKSFSFKSEILEHLHESANDKWPIVYFIESGSIKEAYVGESTDVYRRMSNHLSNPERNKLSQVHIINSKSFNKSATLDIESRLIKYIAADGQFELQNGNGGLTVHNYFQQDQYDNIFNQLWRKLQRKKLVKNSLAKIYNSDLFKYSPYKSLTTDQDDSVFKIIDMIRSDTSSTLFVVGGAGTGKTVLGTYLAKLFKSDLSSFDLDNLDDASIDMLNSIKEIYKRFPSLKIGFVVPQQSLRETLKKVFKYVKGLSPQMVLSASDVTKTSYDLVFVDEAHRLRRRCNLPGGFAYTAFDNTCKKLGLNPNTSDELDWIMKTSKRQVFFYDPSQSVKPTDIRVDKFARLLNSKNTITLKSQLRVLGGNDYINYINDILLCNNPTTINKWGNYDLKLFSNFSNFVSDIKKMNTNHGLCRIISGYSWKWISKGNANLYDIDIDGIKLKWNMVEVDWINSSNSINEVGCIHTSQGYDLNYGGIIFGREIDYNPATKRIEINKELYFDVNGKNSIKSSDELKNYIVNIYKTLMYRGIKGTYVYAYNQNLKDYLSKYLELK